MFLNRIRFNPYTVYLLLLTTFFLAIFVVQGPAPIANWRYIIIATALITMFEWKIVILSDRQFTMSMVSGLLLAISTNLGLFPAMCSLTAALPFLLYVYRRGTPLHVLFNITQYGISAYLAFVAYRQTGGIIGNYRQSEWALLTYVLVYGITNFGFTVVAAICFNRQFKPLRFISHMLGYQTITLYVLEMTVGVLTGLAFHTYKVLGIVVLPIVLWLVGLSYRKYFDVAKAAQTDSLTGLLNRNAFQRELEDRLALGVNLSVLMIDLDHFKGLNDTWGHLYGDQALKDVARVLIEQLGTGGVVSRYGGEEFSAIVTGTAEEVLVTSEQIREKIAAWRPDNNDSLQPTATITASIGIASFPQHGGSLRELLERADNAMYQAKIERNAVKVYNC